MSAVSIPPALLEQIEKSFRRPEAKYEVYRGLCAGPNGFKEFVKTFWSTIIQAELEWNWHMDVICEKLQKLAWRNEAGMPRKHDLIVNIPPGTTKSTLVSILFEAWVWTFQPAAQFICVSYNENLSYDFSRKMAAVVESELYQKCFPDVKFIQDQNTKGYRVNNRGGWRLSLGTGSVPTGFHAHYIVIDDPLNPQAAVSDAERVEVNRFLSEDLSQRKAKKATSVTILIMQRLHQGDPTADMLEKGTAVEHVCLPATDDDPEKSNVKPAKLREEYIDGLLDPIRLSREVLENAEKELGEVGYACQFDQNPIPRGGGMFKTGLIRFATVPQKFKKIVRYWDKAYSGGKGAFTVGFQMGLDHEGHFWGLDMVRGQWHSGEREAIIHQTAVSDGKRTHKIGIEQEPAGGVDSAQATIRRLAGFKVTAYPARMDKAKRADAFSSQVNGSNFYLPVGMPPWVKAVLSEMQFFPASKYKDIVDAMSGAFGMLVEPQSLVGVW